LSGRTVQNYLSKVYDKLQVSRRSQATAVYLSSSKWPLNETDGFVAYLPAWARR